VIIVSYLQLLQLLIRNINFSVVRIEVVLNHTQGRL